MKIDMHIKESGEFRAVRHTGHTFDQDGNEVHGQVLQESAWSKNLILSVGFDALLTNEYIYVNIVAGSGNSAPVAGDTTLQSYEGKGTSQILYSRVINTVPDEDGFCTITTIYRATFNPGELGSSPVNISEAGTAMAVIGSVSETTNLFSRGLIVDSFGSPLVISVNPTVEYLDIYWKHVRYIPAEVLGTQSLSILGSSISHNYTIRPYQLDSANSGYWWYLGSGSGSTTEISGLFPVLVDTDNAGAQYGPRVFDGAISSNIANGVPSGTQGTIAGSSWTFNTYVTGSASRVCKLNLIPTEANLDSGIKSLTLKLGFQGWQVEINPVLMKKATPARVLRLDFTVALSNKS